MFAMTVKPNSTTGIWEDCTATTERGAKVEASKRFDAGHIGDVIEIATKHDDGQYQPRARKVIGVNTKWAAII